MVTITVGSTIKDKQYESLSFMVDDYNEKIVKEFIDKYVEVGTKIPH